MDYCVLSVEEAARLEHYGIWPVCKAHRHLKPGAVQQLLQTDMARLVGGVDTKARLPVSMITMTDEHREWRNRPSGHRLGYKVRQLVRVT